MRSGNSQQSLLSSLEFLAKEKCDTNNPLWSKLSLEFQSKKKFRVMIKKNKRCIRRRLMKRRACLARPIIRPLNSMERKVGILKKLIPNCGSMGTESLFRETADYIMALQMRVKVMKIMVNVLSGSDDHNDE